ncbi:MAG: LemA family protein [Candidatus Tritonobacter lacicola]|nr:LemA family protein [Candidatus Tritonobacter lacicola]
MVIIIISLVLVLILWSVVTFNRLVRGKNLVREAWSGIDVQLKRRYNLIPALVEAVKGYSGHERKLFVKIAEMRSRCVAAGGVREQGEAENLLSRTIKSLFAVAEAYPDLKANRGFLNLQENLSEIEDEIQLARRYYNGTVRNFNIRVESFPGMLVAGLCGFRQAGFFEIEYATERQAPEVKFQQ